MVPRWIAVLLAALVAAATLVTGGTAPAGATGARAAVPTRAAEGSTDPLGIDLDTITPGVIPRTGTVRVSGTVTNLDETAWTTVNLYSFISTTPMTTAAELAAGMQLPDDAYVGEQRIAEPEASATISEIAPGDTLAFSFEVPQRLIRDTTESAEQGVYWFGVQALGQGPEGRVLAGRARTFVPLVGRRTTPLPTSVVLPLRRQITWADDGSLSDLEGWDKALSSGGRLRSLVDLGVSAGSRAVTFLVDPALVDAVGQLAAGNQPRSLAPSPDLEGDGSTPPSPDGSASPTADGDGEDSGDDGADGAADAPEDDLDPLTAQVQAAAVSWLDRLGRALPGHQVLGLPYGDLDVAGAAAHSPRTYAAARKRTGTALAPYGVPVQPAVASPGGYLDEAGLAMLDPEDTVLVSDTMWAPTSTGTSDGTEDPEDPETAAAAALTTGADDLATETVVPTVATEDGHRIVVTSSASTTGPGPGDARSALSVRQATLAQAAVRAIGSDPQPLAVMLPSDWNPVTASSFFSGFDVDWLDLQSVGDLSDGTATPVSLGELSYPRSQSRSELDAESFTASTELMRAGNQLQNLLSRNNTVGGFVRDQALTTVSYSTRSQPTTTRAQAASSTRWVRSQLDKVTVEAPPAVTMTGTSGRLYATITNELDQPVTVDLEAMVSDGIEITHAERIEVPAASEGGRTRVSLTASAPTSGVHRVTLGLTDTDGQPLSGRDVLDIRSLQVSNVIWVFIGAAGVLLFGAIAFRLFKRIRAARRTSREGGGPAGPVAAGADA